VFLIDIARAVIGEIASLATSCVVVMFNDSSVLAGRHSLWLSFYFAQT